MLTLFLLCQEAGLETGEQNGIVKEFDDLPELGQKISIGSVNRWEIVKIEKFLGANDSIFVGYLKRVDLPLLLEQDWDCNRMAREYDSDNESLAIYVYSDRLMDMSFLIDGHCHSVGEILPRYERTGDSSLMQERAPYHQIESIETYCPEQSFYKALYFCRCKLLSQPVAA
jgi:hypothetical protein